MRVNPTMPTHAHRASDLNKPTGDARKFAGAGKLGSGNYATKRPENAAGPLVVNQFKNKDNYATGDGDNFHQPQRPGSDHSYIKSKGHQC